MAVLCRVGQDGPAQPLHQRQIILCSVDLEVQVRLARNEEVHRQQAAAAVCGGVSLQCAAQFGQAPEARAGLSTSREVLPADNCSVGRCPAEPRAEAHLLTDDGPIGGQCDSAKSPYDWRSPAPSFRVFGEVPKKCRHLNLVRVGAWL